MFRKVSTEKLKELSRSNHKTILKTAPDEPPPTGNARFEGFCVDLLEQIAAQVQICYSIMVINFITLKHLGWI